MGKLLNHAKRQHVVFRTMLNKKRENMMKKPKAKLIGEDGNIFNLLGICTKALHKIGGYAEAKEMQKKVAMSNSYHEALSILMEYCDIE